MTAANPTATRPKAGPKCIPAEPSVCCAVAPSDVVLDPADDVGVPVEPEVPEEAPLLLAVEEGPAVMTTGMNAGNSDAVRVAVSVNSTGSPELSGRIPLPVHTAWVVPARLQSTMLVLCYHQLRMVKSRGKGYIQFSEAIFELQSRFSLYDGDWLGKAAF